MTGTTTQMMVDLADLMRRPAAENRAQIHLRLARMSIAVTAFAFGCAFAALLYAKAGTWCFLIPPLIGMAMLASPEASVPPK